MTECSCPLCGAAIAPGRLLVDVEGGLLVGNGQVATLTRQESALFKALWSARPRTLSKEQLLDSIYGLLPDADEPEIKIIDVFVCKIRKKVDPLGFAIETVWGRGYRIINSAASSDQEAAGDQDQSRDRRAA